MSKNVKLVSQSALSKSINRLNFDLLESLSDN